MTSQRTARGRFQRAIHRRRVQAAEMAARKMGGLLLDDALMRCELLANTLMMTPVCAAKGFTAILPGS